MDQPEAGPSRRTPPMQRSSSDDLQIIETSAASKRPARIPRKAATHSTSTTKPKPTKKTAGLAEEKGKGKGKAKEKIDTILVEDSTDEDEPIFVGVASKLAKKYTFKSTSSGSITSSTSIAPLPTTDTGQDVDKPKPPPLILHPPPSPPGKAPSIPAWLGKSSILLQIPYCVVCKIRWKKENGAARWRHISTCLPPLHRPPNPPPDLPRLIHEALLETSGHSTPSLLELHLSTVADPVDNREDLKPDKKKGVQKIKGLARMVNVTAADERGEHWAGQVDEKVASVLGSRVRTPSPSGHSIARSPFSSPQTAFPSTQPLGPSDLANDYVREDSSVSHERPVTPEMDDNEEIRMPPSSQKRRQEEDVEVIHDGEEEPFRYGGGSRAEGDLPKSKSAIWQDWASGRIGGPAWALRRVDPSPVSTVMSITPRAGERNRTSMSPTPTPFNTDPGGPHVRDDNDNDNDNDIHGQDNIYHNTNTYVGDEDHGWQDDQDWGDDAMMIWDATSGRDDDASSVNQEDAGVWSDGDDDDDQWGKDALLAWENDDDDIDFTDQLDETSEDDAIDDNEQVDETEEDLVARGMPAYRDWEIKDLQKLCKGYGYRPINKHGPLVDLAVQCWLAINPPVAIPKLKFRAPSRSSSISSADMPLSKIQDAKRTSKSKSKVSQKGKGKQSAPPVDTSGTDRPPQDLSDRFLGLIRNDPDLWLRILRYEPISFDELISKAIALGIDEKGWKPKLKRFLDLQGVTFFTEDPTGNRRRR